MRSGRSRAGLALLTLLAIGLLAWIGLGWQFSRPVPAPIGAAPPDLHADAIEFPSKSGSMIHAWLSHVATHKGVILLLPGVRANRRSMIERALFLRDAGYSTLLIDFQATGESPGEAITFGWRERLDVMAAVHTVKQRFPDTPIGIIGVSLGGAATVLSAPDLNVQAAVLEAVYPSIAAAVENRLRMRLGGFGAALSPLLLVQLGPRLGISPSELKPIDRIGSLHCPILMIGGAIDEHTTVTDTQRLFAAAREPKELWIIQGAAHVDFLHARGDDYRRRVLSFFEHTFARASEFPTRPAS
jgi:alpha-beta hydrolase superfamily lysophospholipase